MKYPIEKWPKCKVITDEFPYMNGIVFDVVAIDVQAEMISIEDTTVPMDFIIEEDLLVSKNHIALMSFGFDEVEFIW